MKDINSIRILIVEDMPADAELSEREIRKGEIDFVSKIVETENDFIKGIKEFLPDIILSDFALPAFTGMEALKIRNSLVPDTPFIIITGSINEETAVQCIKAGANDYILKGSIARLPFSIKTALEQKRRLEEKVKVEGLLKKEYRFSQSLINTAQVIILTLDINGKIIHFNPYMEEISGHKLEDVKGLDWFTKFIPKQNQSKTRKVFQRAINNIQTKGNIDQIITKDGRYRYIEWYDKTLKDESGNITGLLAVGQDITKRKKAEEILRESKEEINAIYNNAPLLLMLLDSEGRVRKVNNFAIRFSNSDEEKLIGFRFGEAMHCLNSLDSPDGCGDGPNCAQCTVRTVGLNTIDSHKSVYNVAATLPFFIDGKRKEIHFLMSATYINIQNSPMVIISIMDITKLKDIELELIKSKEKAEESDRLKTAFLANMSHEIRTPMNGILGFAELLKDPEIDNLRKEKYIDVINKSGYQLMSIINDIIDISKIEAGQEKIIETCFNLNKMMDELNSLFQNDLNKNGVRIFFHYSLPDSSSYIKGDSIKIKQILTNLIGNALKFTSHGEIEVSYSIKNDKIVFSVKDTGIGILPNDQKLIFERFRQADMGDTRKYGGTGLGLSISKSYTEMMGGKIYLESEFQKGSNFIIELPYSPANREIDYNENDKSNVAALIPNWSSRTILLAEDENMNTVYIKAVLEPTGIKMHFSKNGQEAVEICKKYSDIDLVLMDIKMPIMDGFEATRIIKSFKKNLPVIATTAYALSDDWEKCLEAGCDGYLPKPISINDLYTIMEKFLSN